MNFSVVGGTHEEVNYFENIVKEQNIRNIKFYGYLSRDLIRKHLFAVDVLLLICGWEARTINICSPLKVLESMAAK